METRKILVGLSGGVDSAVSALLLKQAGYDVSGAYIKTWMEEALDDPIGDCPWQTDIEDARKVAKAIGIDFDVVNLISDYRKLVVDYLVEGYKKGITPNPDLFCNKEIKFGIFLKYALENGFDAVATGHYAQKIIEGDGSYSIFEGADKNKDQSYFLALLNQDQLKHALFPIGHLLKPNVREIAKKNNLPNADKKDSQGICFLGKVDINRFLSRFIPDAPGEIINTAGKILGEHPGLHHFTLGQRKGMGIPSNKDYERYVVVGKDFTTNRLVVAFEHPEAPGLFTHNVKLRNPHFINEPITEPTTLLGKPRYRDPSQELFYTPDPTGLSTVDFKNPQRALAPGQLLALYQGEKLLGSGFYV